MKQKIIIMSSIGVVVFFVAGFVAGKQYAEHKTPTGATAFRQMNGGQTAFGNRTGNMMGQAGGQMARGGGAVIGSVLSKDDKSITVSIQGGGSKIVFLSGTTVVSKSATGSVADIETGSEVVVTGTTNTDGSVTAQSIQLRPKQ